MVVLHSILHMTVLGQLLAALTKFGCDQSECMPVSKFCTSPSEVAVLNLNRRPAYEQIVNLGLLLNSCSAKDVIQNTSFSIKNNAGTKT